jgi:hypoxanthine phosphoribosyltransferase
MRILLTEQQIAERVRELGAEISKDYGDTRPVLIGLLKGSLIFLADLMRAMTIPHTVELLCVSSYGSEKISSGQIKADAFESGLTGRHALIVEDIVDTGLTLQYIVEYLSRQQPASLRVCALLDKPQTRRAPTPLNYCGFTIPPVFVVGYGLDWDEDFRYLPYVAVIDDTPAAPIDGETA